MSPTAAVARAPDQASDDGDGIVGLVPRQQREHLGPIDDAWRLHPGHHQRDLAVLGHHQHRQALERHRLVAGEVREVATDRHEQHVDVGLVHAGAGAGDAIDVGGGGGSGAHRIILAQTNDNDTVSPTETASAACRAW